jgi:hypothetical protein
LPISDYDRLSVKEILPLLAPLSETELQLVLAHEKATKNRVTLLRSMKRIELSSPPAKRPKAATPRRAAPAVKSAPKPERRDEAVGDEVVEDEAPEDEVLGAEGGAPVVQAATAEVAPAKPTRGRRARKLRKENAANAAKAAKPAMADGADQNGSRGRHPSTGLRSVEPDIEERQATTASRLPAPVIRTSWEDEAPPLELTWELEDEDELDELVVPVVPVDVEEDDELDQVAGLVEIDDEAAVSDDADGEQEPWGIDDFPDVSEEAVAFEARAVSTPTYEVEDSVEDMVPRHTAAPPPPPPTQAMQRYEFDDDEEDLIDDDILPARMAPQAAATVTPIRPPAPISPAERVIAQPLPPRPEWMKDEPTQVMPPAVPAHKEPVFKSIKSAVVPDMPKPTLTSVLWVAAAIVAILVGILIGMVATRTSPPAAVQLERAAVTASYVAPAQT